MKKFGLIGYPVKGSLSPALFIAGYHGKYRYDLIENRDFGTAYRTFLDEYDGINVTAPFKMDAFGQAGKKSEICTKTGAANLLLKDGGTISAYNTDYYGIVLSILDALIPDIGGYGWFMENCIDGNDDGNGNAGKAGFGFTPPAGLAEAFHGHEPKALIAGCGGAGRAAAVAAASLGYRTVLLNRSVSKAEKIASDIPEYGFAVAGTERFRELFRESDLVIYTIPGNIPELASMDSSFYRGKNKIVLEANYKTPSFGPVQTVMLESEGGILVSGKRWLLYQAMTGFMIFTGERPDFQQMCKVI